MVKKPLRGHYMYTYQNLLDDVAYLGYSGADSGYIGKSELGYTIPYIHLGDYGEKQIVITGGIHARENVTSRLIMRQIYRLKDEELNGGIYFVPMINVDGALLIEKGVTVAPAKAQWLIDVNYGSNDFSLWKANINAVDLNVNFDARFGLGEKNVYFPAPENYVGRRPFDQAETAGLRDFTLRVKPVFTLSYHALGREVYWEFYNREPSRDRALAKSIADKLGYRLVDGTLGSTGGYKDWCVEQGIAAVTVEIIADSRRHPLTERDLEDDWELNKDLPKFLTEIV